MNSGMLWFISGTAEYTSCSVIEWRETTLLRVLDKYILFCLWHLVAVELDPRLAHAEIEDSDRTNFRHQEIQFKFRACLEHGTSSLFLRFPREVELTPVKFL